MLDQFNREITYLRISVTDRCNLRCVFCMPEEGVKLVSHQDLLSFEEIFEVTEAAAEMGVTKVKLTGGEPLVRRNVKHLVKLIAGLKSIKDLGMTTNGILLPQQAVELKAAGLQRVNISLHSINPDRYRELTRGGALPDVLAGITAARKAGLWPIKLNCVFERSSAEEDSRGVAAFAEENGLEVRFIRRMNMQAADFSVVEGGSGGDCSRCNRLRLSSNGQVSPCLFGNQVFSVRDLGARQALIKAVHAKPQSGVHGRSTGLYSIGG